MQQNELYPTLVNESSISKYLDTSSISSTSTIFIRLCNDIEYIVGSACSKIMIEECKNLVLIVNDKVVTSIIEVWKSENITLKLNTQVQTVQVDQCENVHIQYESIKNFYSVVWTNTKTLELKLLEDGEEKHVLSTGDIPNEKTNSPNDNKSDKPQDNCPFQYIIRLIDDQLTSEELIRAEKGFPTTQREWNDYKNNNP
ncbi:6320_t:CDS:2 [Diversispora eburnea]|uniref:6320_t:CDS:1 n=1 Tax=Diversispora eburnea TaxID=1213867 RepID=A0A9N9BEZ9_9GLOM|nr:6320_t:CDS:2 [Diversispora eburnea]